MRSPKIEKRIAEVRARIRKLDAEQPYYPMPAEFYERYTGQEGVAQSPQVIYDPPATVRKDRLYGRLAMLETDIRELQGRIAAAGIPDHRSRAPSTTAIETSFDPSWLLR